MSSDGPTLPDNSIEVSEPTLGINKLWHLYHLIKAVETGVASQRWQMETGSAMQQFMVLAHHKASSVDSLTPDTLVNLLELLSKFDCDCGAYGDKGCPDGLQMVVNATIQEIKQQLIERK